MQASDDLDPELEIGPPDELDERVDPVGDGGREAVHQVGEEAPADAGRGREETARADRPEGADDAPLAARVQHRGGPARAEEVAHRVVEEARGDEGRHHRSHAVRAEVPIEIRDDGPQRALDVRAGAIGVVQGREGHSLCADELEPLVQRLRDLVIVHGPPSANVPVMPANTKFAARRR
ncbi:hypothetical protein [Sorangium atrum]|uniref:Uncharacterized protein n=1 Tax=Sorangium atrum TaxID=2995308 RepID=A0ABT5C2N5_9BACT|nr:hypothetical protein [Sorangium aterium]MDC0680253.1 hypothetical protein [Sorangium aterium]